jgi:hypothetical protein
MSHKEYVEKIMEEKLPTGFVFLYSVVLVLIGCTEITLQIVCIDKNGALALISSGIWGGSFCVVLGATTFSLVLCKTYCLIQTARLMHTFAYLLIFVSLVLINALSFFFYEYPEKFFYFYNRNMIIFNVLMLVFGSIAFVLSIFGYIMFHRIFHKREIPGDEV